MFRDAHTDARTNGQTGQTHYTSGHTTLGRGIMTIIFEQDTFKFDFINTASQICRPIFGWKQMDYGQLTQIFGASWPPAFVQPRAMVYSFSTTKVIADERKRAKRCESPSLTKKKR